MKRMRMLCTLVLLYYQCSLVSGQSSQMCECSTIYPAYTIQPSTSILDYSLQTTVDNPSVMSSALDTTVNAVPVSSIASESAVPVSSVASVNTVLVSSVASAAVMDTSVYSSVNAGSVSSVVPTNSDSTAPMVSSAINSYSMTAVVDANAASSSMNVNTGSISSVGSVNSDSIAPMMSTSINPNSISSVVTNANAASSMAPSSGIGSMSTPVSVLASSVNVMGNSDSITVSSLGVGAPVTSCVCSNAWVSGPVSSAPPVSSQAIGGSMASSAAPFSPISASQAVGTPMSSGVSSLPAAVSPSPALSVSSMTGISGSMVSMNRSMGSYTPNPSMLHSMNGTAAMIQPSRSAMFSSGMQSPSAGPGSSRSVSPMQSAVGSHSGGPPQSTMDRAIASTCICPASSMWKASMTPTSVQNNSMPSSSVNIASNNSSSSSSIIVLSGSPAAIVMSSAAYTCACRHPMFTTSVKPDWSTSQDMRSIMKTHSIRPQSSTKDLIMASVHIMPEKPGQKIPSVYYAYFTGVKSGSEITVSNLFNYANLSSSQMVAVTGLQVVGGGSISLAVGNVTTVLSSASKTNAFVLKSTQKIKVLGDPTFAGVFNVEFTIISPTNESSLNVEGQSNMTYVLYGLVTPKMSTVRFTANDLNMTVNEESDCTWFTLSNVIQVTKASEYLLPEVLPGLKGNESLKNIKMYRDAVKEFKKRYEISLTTLSSDGEMGKWTYKEEGKQDIKKVVSDAGLPITANFCFKPYKDKHGETHRKVVIALKDTGNNNEVLASASLTIRITIVNINDRPKLRGTSQFTPVHLPYNITGYVNNGFKVEQVMTSKKAVDSDSSVIGMAAVKGGLTTLGVFEYKCYDGGDWVQLERFNPAPLGVTSEINAVFLRPNDSLRFNVAGDKFWTEREGKIDASIEFLAWDMSDNVTCGMRKIFSNATSVSALKNVQNLIQLRKGCNDIAGLIPYVDGCGICMGDNSTCMGCDKKLHSTARFDKCLVCAGGDTGLVPDQDLDCANTCNKSHNDSCAVCQVIGFSTRRDCANVCLGSARINKCGNCALGTTGKGINDGEDACGVCGGDNSTCMDCGNVPNGKNKTDLCGNCKLPADPTFNKGCGVKLGNFNPMVIYHGQKWDIKIDASSLENVDGVSCKFNAIAALTSAKANKHVTVSTPANLTAGEYDIKCDFTGAGSGNATAVGKLTVIKLDTISVTSISPSVTNVGSNDTLLTITGAGFVNTPELSCNYGKHKTEVTFVSSTEIKCQFSKRWADKSRTSKVALKFSKEPTDVRFELDHSTALEVPSMTKARYNKFLNGFYVIFNKPGQLKLGATCANIFPHNSTHFGINPKCKFIGRKLKVTLIQPSLGVGNIIVDVSKIETRAAALTLYPANTQQIIELKPDPATKLPKIRIIGTRQVGSCDPIVLELYISGGIPGRLTFAWSVKLADGQSAFTDGNDTEKLNTLNATLQGINEAKIFITSVQSPFTKILTFMLTVSNFLGLTDTVSVNVNRKNMASPRVKLMPRFIKRIVSQEIQITAFASVSKCLQEGVTNKLTYEWHLSPAVPDLERRFSLLRIPGKSLKGNKNYKVTVIVTMAQFSQFTVEDEASIETLPSPLIANIEGVQTIGSNELLKLSAQSSVDPDGATGQNVTYSWEVLNKDKSAVFLPNKERVILPSTPEITLNVSAMLEPNMKYIFSVSFRVGERVATKEHRVKVIDGSPPVVTMIGIPSVDPSKKIRFIAEIDDSTGGLYTWSCEDIDSTDDKLYGLVNVSATSLTPTEGNYREGKQQVSLVFPANSLSGGTYYMFNLTATSKRSTSASAVVEIKTNYPPDTGTLSITPSSGIALNTSFGFTPHGWLDPDGDDVMFEYFYEIGGVERLLAPQVDEMYWLPAGNIKVILRVTDTQHASSETYKMVNVSKPNISNLDFDAMSAKITAFEEEQNFHQLISIASMLIDTIDGDDVHPTDEQKQKEFDLKKGLVVTLLDTESIQTEEDQSLVTGGIVTITAVGGVNFLSDLKISIIQYINEILGILSSSRRRRSLSSPVKEKTPSEIETALAVYSNLISPTAYDTTTMKIKKDFILALNSLTPSMCKGFSVGEAAAFAKNPLTYLQTVNKDLGDVDTVKIKLGCSSCSEMTAPDHVLLGSDIKNLQKCGGSGDQACMSACISSWQMKYDLLSSSSNSSLKSSVVMIKLWDSTTQKDIVVTDIPSGMVVDMVGTNTDRTKKYVCHTWDSGLKTWMTDNVATLATQVVSVVNGTDYDIVKCNLTKIAYLVLMEGGAKIDPTASRNDTNASTASAAGGTQPGGGDGGTIVVQPTTSSTVTNTNVLNGTQPPTTTLAPVNYPRIIGFSFDYPKDNCTKKLTADRSGFTSDIRTKVANVIKVDVDALTEFNVSCASINVKFKLVKSTGLTVDQANQRIRDMVANGTMIILIDNKQVTVNKNSFTSEVDPKYKKPVVKEDDGLGTGAIVGIVIGVIAFLVIVIVIVYFCCIKKSTRKQNTVEPDDNALELKGRSNQAYTGYP